MDTTIETGDEVDGAAVVGGFVVGEGVVGGFVVGEGVVGLVAVFFIVGLAVGLAVRTGTFWSCCSSEHEKQNSMWLIPLRCPTSRL